jgi:pyridoxamine 5'-phosphate oxidase family protein
MVTFTKGQRAYLSEFRLGRLATVDHDGNPHVVPVGFTFNAEDGTIALGGHAIEKTKKFRDAQAHPQVALVVDDIVSLNPWHVRGIEILGRVETFTEGVRSSGPVLTRPGCGSPPARSSPGVLKTANRMIG